MIVPFRDFFGALFFFGFGLTIDPFGLGGAVWPALGAVALTIVGNVTAGALAGRSVKLSMAASLNTGLTIVSRGEFSIIMANLAKEGGLSPVLQPFAALYVLILAVLGPLLTKESERIYDFLAKLFGRLKLLWRRNRSETEDRGSRIEDRGSRTEGRGSRDEMIFRGTRWHIVHTFRGIININIAWRRPASNENRGARVGQTVQFAWRPRKTSLKEARQPVQFALHFSEGLRSANSSG
jgi:hypothetical protein